jgi:hypothetical protein
MGEKSQLAWVPHNGEFYLGHIVATQGDTVFVDIDCRTDFQEIVTVSADDLELIDDDEEADDE